MKLKNALNYLFIISIVFLASCARDLSSTTYTSDQTFHLTLEGKVLSAKPVTLKNTDKLSDNTTGIATGAVAGGLTGAAMTGGGGGETVAAVGIGALAGGVIGAVVEDQLSKANGIEYIIKVNTKNLDTSHYHGSSQMRNVMAAVKASGIITVVQSKDNPVSVGQEVYIITSSKRSRIIAK